MTTVNAIISAYYCEKWLDNRIRNLLEQTRPATPVVVCKSGSQEHAIAQKYKECLIYSTPDVPTVYDAWNRALSFESDYVIIANSDDKLSKFAISKMATILDENPDIGLVYTDSVVVTEEFGEVSGWLNLYDPDRDLREGCYIGHNPMYRTSLHKQYGLYDPSYVVAGDYEFWLRLQRAGVKFHHIKEHLGTFWDRGDNLEFRKKDRLIWEQAKIRSIYDGLRRDS